MTEAVTINDMAAEQNDEIQDLRNRMEAAEAKLRHIKLVLIVAGAVVVSLFIPPLRVIVMFGAAALGVVGIIVTILVPLFAYMYAVIWSCERIFGDDATRPRPDEIS